MPIADGKYEFTETAGQEYEDLSRHYPQRRATLLPALHLVQEELGWIPPEAVEFVAERIGISPAEVMGTMSFYTMFYPEPVGKYVIQFCRTLSCALCGADDVYDYVCRKLGIRHGQTTADGQFSLFKAECLGCCGGGPVMLVNEDRYTDLTSRRIDEILNRSD